MFRLAAVCLGLLPLVITEATLRGLGLPEQPPPLDPYLDLHNLRPLFQASDAPGMMAIPAERLHLFNRVEFPRVKADDTFRVFALGGSTTFGEPYSSATAFPKWLQIFLQAGAPELRVEVINGGGLSYASYRVLAILQQLLSFEPDLIVIYTGHNEYLERRSYGAAEGWRPWEALVGWASQLRLVQCFLPIAERAESRMATDRTTLTREVDALLDYRGGLAEYQRGDAWMEAVPAHFAWNLAAMRELCQAAGVPLILVNPVSNLQDCPPFKFEPEPRLAGDRLVEFDAAWQAARNATSPEDSIEELERALSIDPQHAGANFLLGRRWLERGDRERAEQALQLARDSDVCPLRAPTILSQHIQRFADQGPGVAVVDAAQLFQEVSRSGIVGDQWLVDHIHPSVEGHQLLGEALAARVFELDWLTSQFPDWRERAMPAINDHLTSLGEEYYHRGKQRLQGLELWTQGRAKKVRGEAAISP